MKNRINGVFSYKKDVGKIRVTNEDECRVLVNSKGNVLLMVADGMGGHKKGDYASMQTVSYISDEFKEKNDFLTAMSAAMWLGGKIKKINAKIYDIQDKDLAYKGMGTTLVCALIVGKKLIVMNSGDSRCYMLKEGKLKQITEDQTYVNYLYNVGKISEKEIQTNPNRHVLTNAIGLNPSASYDQKIYDYHGETIMLCSDGLYNNVSNPDIENILKTNDAPEDKVASLINLANFNSGSDNISVALWESVND